MIETLRDFTEKEQKIGKNHEKFFTSIQNQSTENFCKLKHIKRLTIWRLKDILNSKYGFSENGAQEFTDFLIPMLHFDPKSRVSAKEALQHVWLTKSSTEEEDKRKDFSKSKRIDDSSSSSSDEYEDVDEEKQ